jgi:minor extracellular serine protease Vpr
MAYYFQPLATRAFAVLIAIFGALAAASAQDIPSRSAYVANRYALILEDPPVLERFASREVTESVAARSYRQQIEAKQASLKRELATRNIRVTSSVSMVMNAVFVAAPPERVAELKSLTGVKGVVQQRRYQLNLNRATQLVNAPAAWTSLGGIAKAGSGMKVGIIDTGIDQNHASFQDSSIPALAGYPKCNVPNCAAYTNNKVIVARSYVSLLSAGTDPSNLAADSRPDDYSPRDRVGHGTGTASCAAGASNTSPSGLVINGMAPKAYVGNYKVFGSPGLNDFTFDEPMINALNDAVADKMDVVSMSIGGLAITGPLDTGAACGNPTGVQCDLTPPAIESVVKAGMVVVVSAGNDADGAASLNPVALGTVESPADAPSAIAVGASDNSHFMSEGVEVTGPGVPSNLQIVGGAFADNTFLTGAVAAPLRDVTQLGDNGLACSALPPGSLNGSIALILRGTCNFSDKVLNAQNAGATGVILYMADQSALISPSVGSAIISTIMIPNTAGVALKAFIDSTPGHSVFIDGAAIEQNKSLSGVLAAFSSLGPTVGDNFLKPDLVAVGGSDNFYTELYLPTQSYDPLSDLYSANGYEAASGTSFSAPIVAGAALLVKQANPGFTPAQIKSALVNSAAQTITVDEDGDPAPIPSVGNGLLDTGAAVQTTVTVDPVSVSFGAVSAVPVAKPLTITNGSSASVTLSLSVTINNASTTTNVTLDKSSLTLAAGASTTVNLGLSGSAPLPGSYYGFVLIQGGPTTLRVPYYFVVGNGIADNALYIAGGGDGAVGQDIGPLIVRVIDPFGVGVPNSTVTFRASAGASLKNVMSKTDAYGVASAEQILGPTPGNYTFTVTAAGTPVRFSGAARAQPTISAGGIVNAASFDTKPVAPGSYVTIFGSNLSDSTAPETTAILPLAIDPCSGILTGNSCYVTVSFDTPSGAVSVPGHLVYASSGQVNIQVPWELQGQTSANVKVSVNSAFGNVVTVQLSDYAPAFFEIGGGEIAALDANFALINAANPVKRGQVAQLYANGLGPVNNQPTSGDPAPSAPFLATTKTMPTVFIGEQQATVSYSGLAPGFPGLYQINVVVPTTLTAGGTYPVMLSIGGQTAKAANLIVQ